MSAELLFKQYLEFLSLKGDCTGSSESSPVKIPHYWKSRVTAYICPFHDFSVMLGRFPRLNQNLTMRIKCLAQAHSIRMTKEF